jgi:hypothetical protein
MQLLAENYNGIVVKNQAPRILDRTSYCTTCEQCTAFLYKCENFMVIFAIIVMLIFIRFFLDVLFIPAYVKNLLPI